jgi:hypothetical protein
MRFVSTSMKWWWLFSFVGAPRMRRFLRFVVDLRQAGRERSGKASWRVARLVGTVRIVGITPTL